VKRSGWVTGAMVLQFLLALFMTALSTYLLFLTRTAYIHNGAESVEAISGLKIASATIGFPALALWAGWFGMWKRKLWGWWAAVIINLGLAGIFLYSMADDGWRNIDWEVAEFAAVFVLLSLFLLLPPVRGFYWKAARAAPVPEALCHRDTKARRRKA